MIRTVWRAARLYFVLFAFPLAALEPDPSVGAIPARSSDSLLDDATPTTADPLFVLPETESARGWYLRGEVLVLKRRRVDDRVLVVGGTDNLPRLSTSAWSTPFEAGSRLTLGRELTPQTAVELSGFWDDSFSDSSSITALPGSIRQPFFNHAAYGPPTPQIGSQSALVEIQYQTQFYSVEASIRHWWSEPGERVIRLGILAGPRYVVFQEQFQDWDSKTAVRGADPRDSVYETWVSNKLIGGQLGGLIELAPIRRLTILSETRWAGFHNVTDATNRLAPQRGIQYFRASTGEDRFSGMIELGLYARWRPWDWLELSAGYLAFYMWNMTSSPDVLSFNLLNQSKQNNELAFWIHGPTAGLEVRF